MPSPSGIPSENRDKLVRMQNTDERVFETIIHRNWTTAEFTVNCLEVWMLTVLYGVYTKLSDSREKIRNCFECI